MPERQERGWIYILHASQDKLAGQLQQRLNASSYPVWIHDRDSPDLSGREAHIDAVRKAFIVIVLEDKALYRNSLSRELLFEAQRRGRVLRKIVVEIDSKSNARRNRDYSVQAVVRKPASPDLLFRRILDKIELQKSVVAIAPSKTTRSKARYVFLSHVGRKSALVDEIDRELTAMGANVWNYRSSARNTALHFHDEIQKKVENAAAVVIVLNAAWQKSRECRREHQFAVSASRRLIWLWCGRGKPPLPDPGDAVIDLRAHAREQGFALLEKHLYPERRQSKRTR